MVRFHGDRGPPYSVAHTVIIRWWRPEYRSYRADGVFYMAFKYAVLKELTGKQVASVLLPRGGPCHSALQPSAIEAERVQHHRLALNPA